MSDVQGQDAGLELGLPVIQLVNNATGEITYLKPVMGPPPADEPPAPPSEEA